MKKTAKKLTLLCLMAAALPLAATTFNAAATVAQADEISDGISTRHDIIVWRYKTIKGVVYYRQYNASKQKWIGHWEPA